MPNLSPFPNLAFLAFLFVILQQIQSAPLSQVQIDYFIDPSTRSTIQNGGKPQPFKTFPQAFQALKEQVQRFNSTETIATFYCNDGSVFLFNQDETFSLNIENNSFLKLSVKAYSGVQGIDPSKLRPIKFHIRKYANFNLPNTKLVLEGIIFRFDLKEGNQIKELVSFEGENSETIMTKCEFKGIDLSPLKNLETVFNVKRGRMLIKRSKFEDIVLPAANLFQVKNGPDTVIKFELNEVKDITIQKDGALVAVQKAYSLSFLSNNVTFSNGRLISVFGCENAIIYQNNFTGIAGEEYSIYLRKIESVVFSFNNVSGNGFISKGIGQFINIQILKIENITVEGYISDTPTLHFLYNETGSMKPYVVIEKLYFVDNLLLPASNNVNALIRAESHGIIPVSISFENVFFENNTARKAEHHIGSSSTIWIQAAESEVKISKGAFANNIADDGTCNVYINASKISISRALFYNNSQSSINPAYSNVNLMAKEMIIIHGSDFRKNLGVYGGGFSAILYTENAVMRLERSSFLENKAEIGGGFYIETSSEVVLESVFFEKNKAIEGVNYNTDMKVINPKKNKEIVMKTFLWENQTEKIYKSGELKIRNELPSDLFFGPMKFEIIGDKRNQTYKASMNVVPGDNTRHYWPRMKQGFQNREVQGEFSLDLISFKDLDGGRMNKIELIMEAVGTGESFFFVIFLETDQAERLCDRGEMYVFSHKHCFTCPRNSYGLSSDGNACKKCPIGANCTEGGYKLDLLHGYWRDISQDQNVEIHHCGDNYKKCLGGLYSTCAESYTGVLCTACDLKRGYRRYIKGYCEKCGENISGDIGMVVLPIAFMVYSLWVLLGGDQENRERVKLSLLVNLWNNFVRGVFVINSLGLNLPEILSYFIQTFTNSTLPVVNSIACYLDDPVNTSLFWYLSMYLIVFGLKCLVAVGILKKYLNVSLENSKRIIVTWMIYLESLGILDVLLSMITCSNLPRSRFLKFDLLRECPGNFETSQLVAFILIIGVLFFFPMASLGMLEDMAPSPKKQRLQAMIFGRSEDFVKNQYETGFFYFSEAYQHLFLLVFSSLGMIFSTKLLLLMAYYTLTMLFNEHRRILFFQDRKAGLYLVEKYVMAVLSAFALIASYLYMNIIYSWCYYLGLLIIIAYGGFLIGLIVHNYYQRIGVLDCLFGVSWIELAESKRKSSLEESEKINEAERDENDKDDDLSSEAGVRSRLRGQYGSEENVRTSIRHDDDSD